MEKKNKNSKVAIHPNKHKSQILFHNNSSMCDLYTMTLEAGAGLTIRIWTAAASPA